MKNPHVYILLYVCIYMACANNNPSASLAADNPQCPMIVQSLAQRSLPEPTYQQNIQYCNTAMNSSCTATEANLVVGHLQNPNQAVDVSDQCKQAIWGLTSQIENS